MKRSLGLVFILVAVLCFGSLVGAAAPAHPILVTSAGQSADDMILKVMLDRQLEEPVERNPLAQVEDLANIKTLILTVGVSNKGLGSAGINFEQEVARIESLLEEAKSNDIYVILVHVGGPSRRGASSDEVAKIVVPHAQSIIIIADSNQDGFFDGLASASDKELTIVDGRTDVADVITELIK